MSTPRHLLHGFVAPLQSVIDTIMGDTSAFDAQVWEHFFRKAPHTRNIINSEYPLSQAVSFILEHSSSQGELSKDCMVRLRLGATRAAARGFTEFAVLADAVLTVMRDHCYELPFSSVFAAESAIIQASGILNAVARSPETPTGPIVGEVVEVERRSRSISVVRLITDPPLEYRPTQAIPVSSDFAPGCWRDLYPSIPTNDAGQVEFHVHALGDTSSLLASARPGDRWRFGQAHGGFRVKYSDDFLLIAHGTALAAARALIIDLLLSPNQPRVHLFFSADYPGELYELRSLWHLASTCPWLFITPVVRHSTDAWWVGATEHSEAPRGLHLLQEGEVGEIVSQFGSWLGHQILVMGDKDVVEETVEHLVHGGTPADIIQARCFEPSFFFEQEQTQLKPGRHTRKPKHRRRRRT
ncbi:MAG: oxidoreductase [Corynebacterium sp.]|uniref:oxidoreductase n=1 Tax=Corynebacterium sp. TaxID=1720 RepID=UPI0026DD349B|nr:oxidoreductase [Corynebacterium sp.]MDO4760602.1 oxidoreductase [Corynebacterium sp.]